MSAESSRRERWPIAVLASLLVVGAWLRLRSLGGLGLVVDEGNQVLAIRGMLEHGIPLVDSGLVYARNILYMITQALSAGLLGLDEFSLRLPSVVFGVTAIAASYALAATLFDRSVGLLTAAMLTFSLWHIELSRYARFYTAFQTLFVLGLLCFYRGFLLGERRWRRWFVLVLASCVMTHELGGLLALCFLVPVLWDRVDRRRKLTSLAAFAGTAVCWALYRRVFDAVRVALQSPDLELVTRPVDLASRARWVVGLPTFRLPRLDWVAAAFRKQPLISSGVAVLVVAVGYWLVARAVRLRQTRRLPLLLAALAFAFLQQFTLALVLLVLDALIYARERRLVLRPGILAAWGTVAALFGFWFAAMVLAANQSPHGAFWALFGYPDSRRYFFGWLAGGWPWVRVGLAVGSVVLLVRHTDRRDDPAPLFLLTMFYGPLLLVSALRSYHEARYAFHLFPLTLTIFSLVAVSIGRYVRRLLRPQAGPARFAVTVALSVALLCTVRDTRPWEAWAVGDRGYADRRDLIRNVINWSFYADFHQDHKTPASFVRSHRAPGDRVLAFGPPHMVSAYHYYAGGVTHMAGRPVDLGYYRRRSGGPPINWVTGSEVVLGVPALDELIRDTTDGVVWILADDRLYHPDNHYYDKALRHWLRERATDPVAAGLDGHTFVLQAP